MVGLLDAGERLEWWAAFRDRLRELGYVEGRNIAFQARYAAGNVEGLPALARELVQLNVAVIVTSARVAAQAASEATRTIPIVTATGDDPVVTGLATSLARPGGNVTGVTSIAGQLNDKRLELLRDLMPKLLRLAVLWHQDNPASEMQMRHIESAARSMKLDPQLVGIKHRDELTAAFSSMAHQRAGAVFVINGPLFYSERHRLSGLALKHRLPSMYGASDYVDAGGLLSYGPNYPDLFRRAAVYVDKILKGAKPGDLPIEQPTQVSLVVNLKTAKAVGVTIPQSILLRAERVIE